MAIENQAHANLALAVGANARFLTRSPHFSEPVFRVERPPWAMLLRPQLDRSDSQGRTMVDHCSHKTGPDAAPSVRPSRYRSTCRQSGPTNPVEDAAAKVANGVDANSDLYASAEYRAHLARVHAARALRRALERAS